ncbi:hypothetical protein K4L44_02575 [Halosquirtibacter laminarini]|uniref:Uncharacterized protein n=1 Tax=Halosquirtibacter laminarini TaxID=3374600 RepID=A0AC61NGK5_9BACT|nr:hypothetical protein K4L44_02575 [Prolixibacteraceae bacterium]
MKLVIFFTLLCSSVFAQQNTKSNSFEILKNKTKITKVRYKDIKIKIPNYYIQSKQTIDSLKVERYCNLFFEGMQGAKKYQNKKLGPFLLGYFTPLTAFIIASPYAPVAPLIAYTGIIKYNPKPLFNLELLQATKQKDNLRKQSYINGYQKECRKRRLKWVCAGTTTFCITLTALLCFVY